MQSSELLSPADELAISRTSAEFGYLVDRGRATECANLFTPDATLSFGPGSPKPGTLQGAEAIRIFLTARQAQTHVTTRHLATNFRMERKGDGRVEVESLLTVFRSDDESSQPVISIVADVLEIYSRREDGAWRIEERLTTPIFSKSKERLW